MQGGELQLNQHGAVITAIWRLLKLDWDRGRLSLSFSFWATECRFRSFPGRQGQPTATYYATQFPVAFWPVLLLLFSFGWYKHNTNLLKIYRFLFTFLLLFLFCFCFGFFPGISMNDFADGSMLIVYTVSFKQIEWRQRSLWFHLHKIIQLNYQVLLSASALKTLILH